MSEEILAFFGTELFHQLTYQADQPRNRALGRRPQQCFQFAEGHLNRIQVG
jgi:hypothetical protein